MGAFSDIASAPIGSLAAEAPIGQLEPSSQPRENVALEQQFSTGALPHTAVCWITY